jgi:hypothetical protein
VLVRLVLPVVGEYKTGGKCSRFFVVSLSGAVGAL